LPTIATHWGKIAHNVRAWWEVSTEANQTLPLDFSLFFFFPFFLGFFLFLWPTTQGGRSGGAIGTVPLFLRGAASHDPPGTPKPVPFLFCFLFFLFFSLSFLLTFCFCQSREETESQANTVMAKESREGGCGVMAGQRRRKKMTARV
jgi:hypothetical protein